MGKPLEVSWRLRLFDILLMGGAFRGLRDKRPGKK